MCQLCEESIEMSDNNPFKGACGEAGLNHCCEKGSIRTPDTASNMGFDCLAESRYSDVYRASGGFVHPC